MNLIIVIPMMTMTEFQTMDEDYNGDGNYANDDIRRMMVRQIIWNQMFHRGGHRSI